MKTCEYFAGAPLFCLSKIASQNLPNDALNTFGPNSLAGVCTRLVNQKVLKLACVLSLIKIVTWKPEKVDEMVLTRMARRNHHSKPRFQVGHVSFKIRRMLSDIFQVIVLWYSLGQSTIAHHHEVAPIITIHESNLSLDEGNPFITRRAK